MQPLISIIIPVYNRTNLLSNCLASVAKQTWENKEVIVVDDGSTEDVKKV
jgi:glycosyltransferase involved in cell wall biosynthesis